MIVRDLLLEQIQRFVERLGGARRRANQGEHVRAADDLTELLRDVQALWERARPDELAALRPVAAEVGGELGLLYARLGQADDALSTIDTAIDILRPNALADDATPRDVGLYATLLLNAGATRAAIRELEAAKAHFDEALERVQSVTAEEADRQSLESLAIAALQNRSSVARALQDEASAERDLRDAYERAERWALEVDDATSTGLVIDLGVRLAALLQDVDRLDEALQLGRRQLERAEELVDAHGGRFAGLFVQSKMLIAQLCFAANDLAEGEDQLFEVIDAVPEVVDVVLQGIDYYLSLWTRPDDRLEEGGLPRDEVADSLAELLAKLDVRNEDDLMRQLVRARYDLVVNGDDAGAKSCPRIQPTPDVDPRHLALQRRLDEAMAARAGDSG